MFQDSLLEDFETGIATFWWVDNDGTGEMALLPGREPRVTEISGGRCGTSRFALNITAGGLSRYGGGFGINFFPHPLDVTEWDGISFWARRGEAGGRTLFFAVSDRHTDEFGQYVGFHTYDGMLKQVRDEFWGNQWAWGLYQDYVIQMLYRQNTYTGVMYKDDPAIMIWEVMNEPRYGPWEGDTSARTVRDWLEKAADFIKQHDPNHLVGTGEEGFLHAGDHNAGAVNEDGEWVKRQAYPWDAAAGEGISFLQNAAISSIDVLGFHCWPFQWGLWDASSQTSSDRGEDNLHEYPDISTFPPEWIEEHVAIAEAVGKPLYLGEFGLQVLRREGSDLTHRDAVMKGVYDTAMAHDILAGVAYWHMTASHDVDQVAYHGPIIRNTLLQALFWDEPIPHDNDFRFDVLCPEDVSTCRMIADYSAWASARVTSPDPPFEPPCLPPKTTCGKSCVLLPSHPEHCGACNTICALEETCRDGVCTPLVEKGGNGKEEVLDDGSCRAARVGRGQEGASTLLMEMLLPSMLLP